MSPAGWQALEPEVARGVEEVAALGPAGVAAFDADGTIWRGDLGEDFLRDLFHRGRLLDPPPGDAFDHYERLFQSSPADAFAFCVAVMRGLPVSDVERFTDEFWDEWASGRVFPGMRAVLDHLLAGGTRILLVSASPAVSIRRAALKLGLPEDSVLGVEGRVTGGSDPRLTGEVILPITCAEGKVEALRRRLGDRPVSIAFGNSLLDEAMLTHAQRAVMVAPAAKRRQPIGADHGPAIALAITKGWVVHRPIVGHVTA